ncbi:IclR family transcriptional regulator [Pseudorhodoferax sp.]|uniref:IclR family transcriptional regulator n=1 Tax=Pseudorhodoferax sp. TaxID=1993553 RepID=UPI0039E44981
MEAARQARSAPADSGAPAVERAVQLLLALSATPDGLGAQALAAATGMPRATLYRVVRVLLAHGFLQAAPGRDGLYRLGPALARLGAQVQAPRDLVTLARPVMQRLARTVGETVKLVVRDGLEAVTLAVADAELDARVTSRTGTRLPLHMGASQRLLLAHADAALWRQVLARPLERRTSRTFGDPQQLRQSLELLRRTDSVQGHGEGIDGVGAAATLVRGAGDVVLGALVAVYIHPGKSTARRRAIAQAVEAAAQEISAWQLPVPA